MIKIEQPKNLIDIINSTEKVYLEATNYWDAFSTKEFFEPIGKAWSPAENVRHLNKSTKPLIMALSIPPFVLRILFGKPKKPSKSYDELKETYLAVLSAGGNAGKYAPSPQSENNLENWRKKIMSERNNINKKLVNVIKGWSETSLDHYFLPHPLLKKLTIREMLFFTIYHNLHHIQVIERRKAELK